MKRLFVPLLLGVFLLLGCQAQPAEIDVESQVAETVLDPNITERHNTLVPEPYVGVSNPVTAEDATANHGSELYSLHCSACHGDSGLGDGPAGQVLDPPATSIAQTSHLVGDDYLFWRISEGGSTFGTAMPAWKGTLTDSEIWSLINYLRMWEEGQVHPNTVGSLNVLGND